MDSAYIVLVQAILQIDIFFKRFSFFDSYMFIGSNIFFLKTLPTYDYFSFNFRQQLTFLIS